MKKTSLLLLLLVFLTACGPPSEEAVYDDVIAILQDDVPEQGISLPDFSSQTMTEFKDLGDGLYEVNGNINSEADGIYSYSMKIQYEGDEYVEYEWTAER